MISTDTAQEVTSTTYSTLESGMEFMRVRIGVSVLYGKKQEGKF
jgi:hypothetical protein